MRPLGISTRLERFVARGAFSILSAVALAAPVTSRAQSAGVGAALLSARHDLLGDPLVGGRFGAAIPLRNERLAVRLGAEWLRGQAERTGVPCVGLIPPGTCPPEPLRDDADLWDASGGIAIQLLGARRVALALTGDLSLGMLRARTRGLESGTTLPASKALLGLQVGAEVTWAPSARAPLMLEVGGAVGRLRPVIHQQVVDGYTPFEDGFAVRRLWAGVAWHLSRSDRR